MELYVFAWKSFSPAFVLKSFFFYLGITALLLQFLGIIFLAYPGDKVHRILIGGNE